jgi:nucleoside-diphosphate-sugar epimerase
LISAAQAPNVEGRTIDIGSGELVSIRSIVQHIFNIIDSGNSPSFGAIEDRPMEQVRVADTENTHAMIGWKAKTPLEKGLKETVAWYREQIKETEEKKCCKTTQSADMR